MLYYYNAILLFNFYSSTVYICDDYDGGGDHITIKYKIAF